MCVYLLEYCILVKEKFGKGFQTTNASEVEAGGQSAGVIDRTGEGEEVLNVTSSEVISASMSPWRTRPI